MMFQTAEALRRADAGDAQAYSLVRILTPLIKFRACRDARKVTGDAMEVRGGCGYIEEWSDARLVRDAHLGSIWEGTSNIVVLDVMRAINRDSSLVALNSHLGKLLLDVKLDVDQREMWGELKGRVMALATVAAVHGGERMARRAASALYHLTAAIAMAWEASQSGSKLRMHLAKMAVKFRLSQIDPLSTDVAGDEDMAEIFD
jgi:acyl-CoA dehydrogenase